MTVVSGCVLNELLPARVSASDSASLAMPALEETFSLMPSAVKLSSALPPAGMFDSVSVWFNPSLARVNVSWPGAELVNV